MSKSATATASSSRTAGGGGWGDPLERPPERVRNDVARGLLSAAAAEQYYGVAINGPRFDADANATHSLRESLRSARKSLPMFDFGQRQWESQNP